VFVGTFNCDFFTPYVRTNLLSLPYAGVKYSILWAVYAILSPESTYTKATISRLTLKLRLFHDLHLRLPTIGVIVL